MQVTIVISENAFLRTELTSFTAIVYNLCIQIQYNVAIDDKSHLNSLIDAFEVVKLICGLSYNVESKMLIYVIYFRLT